MLKSTLTAALFFATAMFASAHDDQLQYVIKVAAKTGTPITLPEERQWRTINDAGVQVAVVAGKPNGEGPYSVFMKVPAGVKIPPHTHNDKFRHSLIISGTFYFAFGETWDDAKLKPLGPGSFWTEAPTEAHYGEVREGEVIALVTAFGPTSTNPVKPKN